MSLLINVVVPSVYAWVSEKNWMWSIQNGLVRLHEEFTLRYIWKRMLYDLFWQGIHIAALSISPNFFHSRWSISALLILSINLKHENNNMATFHRIFLYLMKLNQSDQRSFWFCHHQVPRGSASCCSDFLVSPSSRRLTEL